MPECRSLKIGYHSGPVSLSILATATLSVAGAVTGPARQQRRHQVRDRSADRLVDVQLRGRVFLQLQIAHADDEPRDAIGLVDGQDALGELDALLDIAVGERGDEGAVQTARCSSDRCAAPSGRTRRRKSRPAPRWRAGPPDSCPTSSAISNRGGWETAPNCRSDVRASAPKARPAKRARRRRLRQSPSD